jgi:protein TonB
MFASSWSAPQPRNPKRFWILTSSVVLHGLVFAFLAAIEVWHVEAVAEPPANDVFEVQLPPPPVKAVVAPPAAAAPASPAPHKAAAVQPPAPADPATPSTVPQADPLKAAESPMPQALPMTPTSPVSPESPSNGDEVGTDPNGRGTRGSRAGDGPVGGDGVLPVGGPIDRPQVIKRVQPLYTERARRIRLQGTVILQATIDEQGNVIDVQVVKGLPMGLDDEAVRAVRQWRFTPGMLRGRPVKVYFNLTVLFQVN